MSGPDDISDLIGEAPTPAPAATPAATPTPPDPEMVRSTVEHLVNTGATREQVMSYIQSTNGAFNLRGLEAALTARDHGLKVHIPVRSILAAQPDQQPAQPDQPPAHDDISDLADPLKAHGLQDYMDIGARAAANGLAAIPDTLATVGHALNPLEYIPGLSTPAPKPLASMAVNGLADLGGMASPQTDNERLASAVISGATGGLATGGEAAVPMALSALSGATAGGSSELARQGGAGPMGQLAAGVAGGFLAPTAMALGGRALQSLPGMAERAPNEFLQAAKTAGVDQHILPADAGGPVVRALSSGTAQTPFGGAPIVARAQALNDAAAARVAAEAAAHGEVQSGETLGDTIRSGLESAIKQTKAVPRAGYTRAASLAGDSTVDLATARAVVDDQIHRLEATAQIGAVPGQLADLRATRAELDRPLSVQGVRDMRTEMYIAPELRGTPAEARQRAIVDAAAEDTVNSLRAAGKGDAADEFAKADALWKQRLQLIDQTIKPLLGSPRAPKSGEAIVKSVNAAMTGNASRFGTFVHALPEEQQGIVRASLINPLGRDKDGVFSISRFADNWRDISPNAKLALFGRDSVDALDALAVVGQQAKQAMRYANHSNTTRGMEVGRLFTYVTALPSLGTTVLGQFGFGKLLSSPAFARWLASSVKKPNAAAQLAHVNRLTSLAARQPAIANDVLSLQQRLREGFAQAPQPLAAQPQDQPSEAPADPYAAFPLIGHADKSQWDKRADGTEKGTGWLGLRQRPDGSVSSEISVDFGHGDIPVMVPNLTPNEVHWLMTTPVEQVAHSIPHSIAQKAIDWAKQRKAQGLSPFRQPGEQSPIAAVNQAEQGQ